MDIGKIMIDIVNFFVDVINALGNGLSNVLPNSPFTLLTISSDISYYIGVLNWIIPISAIVSTMEVWLVAVGTYYLYSVILRWLKAIN